jgi:hypothetical protein
MIGSLFGRSARLQAQRVQTAVEFIAKHHVDGALDLHAAETAKRIGNDPHIIMCFPFGRRTGMACMSRAVIVHIEFDRFEGLDEFFTNPFRSVCQFWSPGSVRPKVDMSWMINTHIA